LFDTRTRLQTHYPAEYPTGKPDSRDEQGSGLDRIGSGLKPILAGWGLDRTAIFF